jgi:organic radical activating enzyme
MKKRQVAKKGVDMVKNKADKKGYSSNDNGNQQFRENVQNVISKTAKMTNSNYIKAINNYSNNPEWIKTEYLQQKVLKLAERKMSRTNFSNLIDQVHKLDASQKKPFLQQLLKQLDVR